MLAISRHDALDMSEEQREEKPEGKLSSTYAKFGHLFWTG